jgi:hypothetical protein
MITVRAKPPQSREKKCPEPPRGSPGLEAPKKVPAIAKAGYCRRDAEMDESKAPVLNETPECSPSTKATLKCSPRLQAFPECSTDWLAEKMFLHKKGSVETPAVAEDADDDDHGSDVVSTCTRSSSAGDAPASADEDEDRTAVAARDQAKLTPLTPQQADPHHWQSGSAAQNSEAHVGNIGFPFGNWGHRPTVLGTGNEKKARQETHDRQIMKCRATMAVLAEASLKVTIWHRPFNFSSRLGSGSRWGKIGKLTSGAPQRIKIRNYSFSTFPQDAWAG